VWITILSGVQLFGFHLAQLQNPNNKVMETNELIFQNNDKCSQIHSILKNQQHQVQNKCSTKFLIVQHNRTQELWYSTHQNSTKHRINQELHDLPKDNEIQELRNSRQQLNITQNDSRTLEINRTWQNYKQQNSTIQEFKNKNKSNGPINEP